MNPLLIKNSRLVTEKGILQSDLLIEKGKISQIGKNINLFGKVKKIEGKGLYTMPGVIDPHVHLELNAYNSNSSDDFYTGSLAAAGGGVTTFIDFAIPEKGQTMSHRIKEKKISAKEKSIIDYSFHAQIINWEDNIPEQMEAVSNMGITSFKIFMPATEGWGVDAGGLYEALKYSKQIDSLIMVHAENGEIADHLTKKLVKNGKTRMTNYSRARPSFIEKLAVVEAALVAQEAQTPVYICHLSSGKAAIEIMKLKNSGQHIFVETTPQYLTLDNSKFSQKNSYLYACCPPIRDKKETYQIWRALLEGDIDTVGTDHCPFLKSEKEAGKGDFTKTPFGLPGVENSLPLLYTEGVVKRSLSMEDIYEMISLNPAKIFGLYPEKGTLQKGTDADLVVFNPAKKVKLKADNLLGNCDWSPYENKVVAGYPEYTISRGEIIYKKGNIPQQIQKGRGNFLKRK